ncbi:hypothetical protein PENSPDRAFT_651985 [Peniophora sp. CONT]|nr:hypothetical protein PENSPDRAFT_651985 [Peniophora sp. CONT]
MSSDEENQSDSHQSSKPKKRIRRLQRACDTCKRKKIRCDWAAARGNKCTYCRTHQVDCSYTHGDREEKHGTPEEYVESLERSVKLMAAWMYRHHPDLDLTLEFGIPSDIDKWMDTQRSNTNLLRPSGGEVANINLSATVKDEPESSDDETFKLAGLQDRMENVHIVDRFLGRGSVLGKSSGVALIKSALEMKDEGLRQRLDPRNMRAKRDPFWDSHAGQYEQPTFDARLFDFPPTDLMYSLLDIWYNTRSITLPLLHQPTFMRNLSNGLHYRDGAFAAIVLVVCAIASRFCNDRRVLYGNSDSWFSAGWKYYHQARMHYKPSMSSPSLHDIQLQVLFCLYLEGSSMPQACWTTCGTAIRLAMDVGAHKKKAYHTPPIPDEEQWKRAFWILVIMDRWLSAQLGRSCSIQEEDFDLDLPIDVDDEYWDNPDPAQMFKQPPGRPSRMGFFIGLIKLGRVLGVALRSIFSMNPRSNILLELIGKGWEQRIITALDSALNEWVDNIPAHLKWDPTRTDPVFTLQSGVMYAHYYEVQIMIHRCFIPTPQKPSQTTFPSLAICTNAARSCCQIIASCRSRLPQWRGFIFQMAAFTSALVLIFSIWGARRNGMAIDTTKDMERICQCMEILKDAEPRWAIAGRLWDILYELVFMGDLPLPTLPPSNEASPDNSYNTEPSTAASGSSSIPSPAASSSVASANSGLSNMSAFIPAHSSDLGRLPLHIPLTSVTDPASYGSSGSHPDPFGAGASSETNPQLDDVLAAFGFGPVSFGAPPPSMPAEAGPSATPEDEPSNWPDFSLNMDSSGWSGFFSSISSATGHAGQSAQADLDAFWGPQQAAAGSSQSETQQQQVPSGSALEGMENPLSFL